MKQKENQRRTPEGLPQTKEDVVVRLRRAFGGTATVGASTLLDAEQEITRLRELVRVRVALLDEKHTGYDWHERNQANIAAMRTEAEGTREKG